MHLSLVFTPLLLVLLLPYTTAMFMQAISAALATVPFTAGPLTITAGLAGTKLAIGAKLLYFLGLFGRGGQKASPAKSAGGSLKIPSGFTSSAGGVGSPLLTFLNPYGMGYPPLPFPYSVQGGFPGAGFLPSRISAFQRLAQNFLQQGAGAQGYQQPFGAGQGFDIAQILQAGAEQGFSPAQMMQAGAEQGFSPAQMMQAGAEQGFSPVQMMQAGQGFSPAQMMQAGAGQGFNPAQMMQAGAGQGFNPAQMMQAGAGQGFNPAQMMQAGSGHVFNPAQVPQNGGGEAFNPAQLLQAVAGQGFNPAQLLQALAALEAGGGDPESLLKSILADGNQFGAGGSSAGRGQEGETPASNDAQEASPGDDTDPEDTEDDVEGFFTFLQDMDDNKCISRLICDIGGNPNFLGEFSQNINNIIRTLEAPEDSKASHYVEILKSGGNDCAGKFSECTDEAYNIVKSVAPSVGIPQNLNSETN